MDCGQRKYKKCIPLSLKLLVNDIAKEFKLIFYYFNLHASSMIQNVFQLFSCFILILIKQITKRIKIRSYISFDYYNDIIFYLKIIMQIWFTNQEKYIYFLIFTYFELTGVIWSNEIIFIYMHFFVLLKEIGNRTLHTKSTENVFYKTSNIYMYTSCLIGIIVSASVLKRR